VLKRWPAETLDLELARRNPVPQCDVAGAAHTPAATALLRHIFELADGADDAATRGGGGPHGIHVGDASAAGGGSETGAALAEPGGEGPAAGHRGRRVATTLAALMLLGAGASAAVMTLTATTIPHRTTTSWLASRPLAADERSAADMGPRVTASPWQLVGHLAPAGWKLGTPGPGPGMVTCPTTAVCYVTGDSAASRALGSSGAGGLYVSTNGASSWSVLALPQGVTFTSQLTCVSALVCAAGGIDEATAVFAETRDGGHRWTVTTTGDDRELVRVTCLTASRCMALSLPASSAKTVVSATSTPRPFDESFVRTTDGGNTWTATPLPVTVHFSSLQCTARKDCVTVGFPAGSSGTAPRGLALRTDDGGSRWTRGVLPAGVGFSSASGLSCSGPTHCMAVATVAVANASAACSTAAPRTTTCASGSTWVSTPLTTDDEGATWQVDPLPASVPAPHLDDVACAGPLTCWAGGEEAAPSRKTAGSSVLVGTADGGNTWVAATVPVPAPTLSDKGATTYAAVGSISCPSATVCVAIGVVGRGAKSAPVYRMDVAP
jgi:hypothetical protein